MGKLAIRAISQRTVSAGESFEATIRLQADEADAEGGTIYIWGRDPAGSGTYYATTQFTGHMVKGKAYTKTFTFTQTTNTITSDCEFDTIMYGYFDSENATVVESYNLVPLPKYIHTRISPSASEFLSVVDTTTYNGTSPLTRFGMPILNRSSVTVSPVNVSFDTRDTYNKLAYKWTLTKPDCSVVHTESDTPSLVIGDIDQTGLYEYELEMVDSYGKTFEASGEFVSQYYTPPTLSTVRTTNYEGTSVAPELLSRYGLKDEYVEDDFDDTGTKLWFCGKIDVYTIEGGTNPWVVKVNGQTLYTGLDGTEVTYVKDPVVFEDDVSAGLDHEYTVTIEDWFGDPVSYDVFVPKTTALFNIEPHGVAVGMMSTGTLRNPLFESAYPSALYGGISVCGMINDKPIYETLLRFGEAKFTTTADTKVVGTIDQDLWDSIDEVVDYDCNIAMLNSSNSVEICSTTRFYSTSAFYGTFLRGVKNDTTGVTVGTVSCRVSGFTGWKYAYLRIRYTKKDSTT